MNILKRLFPSWFENNTDPLTQSTRKRRLEDELILMAGDSGDGICRSSLHSCMEVWCPGIYTANEIDECIEELLASGHLLTDGERFIDPHTLPNGAKRIRNGWKLLSHERIDGSTE